MTETRALTSIFEDDSSISCFEGNDGEERLVRRTLPSGTVRYFEGQKGEERLVRECVPAQNGQGRVTKFFIGTKGAEVLDHLTSDPVLKADGSIGRYGWTEHYKDGRKVAMRLQQAAGDKLCVSYMGEAGRETASCVHLPCISFLTLKRSNASLVEEVKDLRKQVKVLERKAGKVNVDVAKRQKASRTFLSKMEADVAGGSLREGEFNEYARLLAAVYPPSVDEDDDEDDDEDEDEDEDDEEDEDDDDEDDDNEDEDEDDDDEEDEEDE